jgi:SAM-dependent methyltransferase
VSHPEQLAYLAAVIAANRDLVTGARVLEVGSYDVNGSVRGLFDEVAVAVYTGVDLVEGPGVDRVQYGHEVDDPAGSFDVTLSAECFEHDPNWRETFANMVRLTRPGGVVTFTCASVGRVEHGTRRTLVKDSPGTQAEGVDYYRNLTADNFSAAFDLRELFGTWRFDGCPTTFDLYFTGIRSGAETGGLLPDESRVSEIPTMMPLAGRAVRWPLRLLRASTKSETAYQRLAVPYWLAMIRLARALGVGSVASH